MVGMRARLSGDGSMPLSRLFCFHFIEPPGLGEACHTPVSAGLAAHAAIFIYFKQRTDAILPHIAKPR